METEEINTSGNLTFEDLVRENYNQRVSAKILAEFDELPPVITGMSDESNSGGEYYEYVKKCISNGHTEPSAVDFCSRFLKDGKYTFGEVSEESFDDFINSEELFLMIQV